MAEKDFDGINFFKYLIFFTSCIYVLLNILGPYYFYEQYLKLYIYVEAFFLFKAGFFTLMAVQSGIKSLRILKRVKSKKSHPSSQNRPRVYHAIVLPIYHQSNQIVSITLELLSRHSRAQKNYLVFLAFEERSPRALQRAEELISKFKSSFKIMHYTLHKLKPGECPGKATNQNVSLQAMQHIFYEYSIDTSKVLFTTLDCDNWMAQAYFEQIENFLNNHSWNFDKYLFWTNQLFSINIKDVSLLIRQADIFNGSGVFTWCNTVTKVQNAVSNFTLSYKSFKKHGFFDAHHDALTDDFHTSMKMMWKRQGDLQIIPAFVMANMHCLQTGKGQFQNLKARFWQAQRHMKSMLDAAYNFNMLFKNPLRVRTLWATISYFQTNFLPIGLYLPAILFTVFKVIHGIPFTIEQKMILSGEFIFTTCLTFIYFYVARQSAKVLYGQENALPWKWFFQQVLLNKVILILFVVIPQLTATFLMAFKTPTFISAPKVLLPKRNNSQ